MHKLIIFDKELKCFYLNKKFVSQTCKKLQNMSNFIFVKACMN